MMNFSVCFEVLDLAMLCFQDSNLWVPRGENLTFLVWDQVGMRHVPPLRESYLLLTPLRYKRFVKLAKSLMLRDYSEARAREQENYVIKLGDQIVQSPTFCKKMNPISASPSLSLSLSLSPSPSPSLSLSFSLAVFKNKQRRFHSL